MNSPEARFGYRGIKLDQSIWLEAGQNQRKENAFNDKPTEPCCEKSLRIGEKWLQYNSGVHILQAVLTVLTARLCRLRASLQEARLLVRS